MKTFSLVYERIYAMKKDKLQNYSYEILDETNDVASATECTGLIQIPPTNLNEAKSYSDIYVIPNQINKIKKKHRKK